MNQRGMRPRRLTRARMLKMMAVASAFSGMGSEK
jgi:hypothetical protein